MTESKIKEKGFKKVFENADIVKIHRKKNEGPTIFFKKFEELVDNNKTAIVIDKDNKKRPVRLTSIKSFEGNFDKVI